VVASGPSPAVLLLARRNLYLRGEMDSVA
jgi:hypothetical protein